MQVIVFKRYSEIRALYKELKIIYESKNVQQKKFPRFAKGHYFGKILIWNTKLVNFHYDNVHTVHPFDKVSVH